MKKASEAPHETANRQWVELHATIASLLAALTRIENHIKAGDPEAALTTIARARVTAARNKAKDVRPRAR